MSTDPIFLIGAGGHGRVVLDAMLKCGYEFARIRVRDDDVALKGKALLGHPIETPAVPKTQGNATFHVSIGDGTTRKRTQETMERLGMVAATIVHPATAISPFAVIAEGSFIAAMSVVGPSSTLGKGVIVNHGAVVDHDCVVGAFSHISPGASLGGGAIVGERTLIGAGAVVLPGMKIGDGVVVAAGAVVINDVADGAIVAGVPAAPIK